MRVVMTSLAVLALMACSKPADAPANDINSDMADTNATMMDANATAAATPAALADIKSTSWEFTDKDGQAIQESVDENGNYVAVSGTKHIDHGTAIMKDGKACFTSAMTKEGEVCWTDPMAAIGNSGETTSDKGEKLTVKRVEYKALTM
ncbi:hypothetical protein [Sphingomonas jaspsi]|uniref:hypothetical protein n=1 Tax=Sphingomonas jaspsi TaxID=392409 RepID=UPI0004AD6EEA|nr:hypothetical protein [Sphingomonas jaspsi]